TLNLTAVLPVPNTSYEMPTRGLRSFQFVTRPTHPFARSFLPSGQVSNLTSGLNVPAGSVSGSRAPMNQSQRSPALIVARLIVQRSWANTPLSFLMLLRRSVGMRRVTDVGVPLLKVTGCTSRGYDCTRRHFAWLIVAPNRIECAPVTNDAANCSVNSLEKWSAGLF